MPEVMNIFDPFRRQPPACGPSLSGVARVVIRATSDPPEASVTARAPIASPARMRGTMRAHRAGPPAFSSGPSMIVWLIRLAISPPDPARVSSIVAMIRASVSHGVPPNSAG